jgi:hypothetical protein
MSASITTLFEAGPYEAGVASLLNSLLRAGFDGRVWCGVRGPIPPWLMPDEVKRSVGDQIDVRAVSIDPDRHLALYKPHFMMSIAREEPSATSVMYFDPDIVVKCEWDFVERWAARGIATVVDMLTTMPASSPIRAEWLELCDRLGITLRESAATLDVYCNSGFVGVSRDCLGFLELWCEVIDVAMAGRQSPTDKVVPRPGGTMRDQDSFNIALMAWAEKACVMGPEAMDFIPGEVFSHANVRPAKPWAGHFVRRALMGRPPGRADRQYLLYRGGPFDPPGRWRMRRQFLSYKVGRMIGTLLKRPES